AAHVRGGIPLVADGLRRRGGDGALRDHARRHRAPAPGGAGGAAVRLRPGPLVLHAGLVAGALAVCTPLLWMVSASLMPTGEANSFPPRLLPSAATVAH